MSCTMGWVQLPPTFSAMSETIADVANATFRKNPKGLPEHHLDQQATSMDRVHALPEPEPHERKDDKATDRLCHLVASTP